jgi:hypothetical protein
MNINDLLILKPKIGNIGSYPLLTGIIICDNKVEELTFDRKRTFFHYLDYINQRFLKKKVAILTEKRFLKFVNLWYETFFKWKLPNFYWGRIENLLTFDFPTFSCLKIRNELSLDNTLDKYFKSSIKLKVKLEKFLFPPIKRELIDNLFEKFEDLEGEITYKEEDIFPPDVLEELNRLRQFFKENEDVVKGSVFLIKGSEENKVEDKVKEKQKTPLVEFEEEEKNKTVFPIENEDNVKLRTIQDFWDNISLPILYYYLNLILKFPNAEAKFNFKRIFDKSSKLFTGGKKFYDNVRPNPTIKDFEKSIIEEFLFLALKNTNYRYINNEKECLIESFEIWKILRTWIEGKKMKRLKKVSKNELLNRLRDLWFRWKTNKMEIKELYIELAKNYWDYLVSNWQLPSGRFKTMWTGLNKKIIVDELNMDLNRHKQPLEVSMLIYYFLENEEKDPYLSSFLSVWRKFLPKDLLTLDVGKVEYGVLKRLRCKALTFNFAEGGNEFFKNYLNYLVSGEDYKVLEIFRGMVINVLPQKLDLYKLLSQIFL